jgi:hypothetical protein
MLIHHRLIQVLTAQNRVTQIVLDECHEYVIDVDKAKPFRAAHALLRGLMTLGIRATLMSGTIPPATLESFTAHYGLAPREFKQIRAPCVRTDIHFLVEAVPREFTMRDAAFDVVSRLVRLTRTRYPRSRKHGIVYCQSKADVEAVACLLANGLGPGVSITSYWADKERAFEDLAQWRIGSAEINVMVTTTALLVGIHQDTIRFGVILGYFFGVVNIMQGLARVGRDGRGGVGVLLTDNTLPPIPLDPVVDVRGASAYHDLLKERICRRRPLEHFLDGTPTDEVVPCSSWPNYQYHCDLCQPQVIGAPGWLNSPRVSPDEEYLHQGVANGVLPSSTSQDAVQGTPGTLLVPDSQPAQLTPTWLPTSPLQDIEIKTPESVDPMSTPTRPNVLIRQRSAASQSVPQERSPKRAKPEPVIGTHP